MQLKRAIAAFLFLFATTPGYAGVKIWSESCISDHVGKTNCYQVRTSIYSQDEDGNVRLVAEGYSWVGSDCPAVGHKSMPKAVADCSPVTISNVTFTTSNESPGCLNKYLNDPQNDQAIIASITAAISRTSDKNAALKIKPQGLNVFPNPAHGYLNIDIGYDNAAAPASLYVYDATGRAIASMNVPHTANAHFTLSLQDVAPGYYTVVVKDAKSVLGTKNVLIQ
jgi:hypothetical protein